MMNDLPPIVEQVGRLGIHGPIVPMSWLCHIRTGADLPDANAVFLLAIIIDWYQPMPIYDENHGSIVGYAKKFRADKLQLGYSQIMQLLGLTRYQARQAIKSLQRHGLIEVELRTVVIGGTAYSNVMFVAPIPQAVAAITDMVPPRETTETPSEETGNDGDEGGMSENRYTLPRKTGIPSPGKPAYPPPENRGTYTTTTTIPTTTPSTDIARNLRAKQNRFDAETTAILEALNGHRMTAEEKRRAYPYLAQVQEALGKPLDVATVQDIRVWYKTALPGYPCTWKAVAGNFASYQNWIAGGRKTSQQQHRGVREHNWDSPEDQRTLEAIRERDRAAGWDKN